MFPYSHVRGGVARPGDRIYEETPEGRLFAVGGVVVALGDSVGAVVPVDLSEPPVEDYSHPKRSRSRLSVWREERRRYQQPGLFEEGGED